PTRQRRRRAPAAIEFDRSVAARLYLVVLESELWPNTAKSAARPPSSVVSTATPTTSAPAASNRISRWCARWSTAASVASVPARAASAPAASSKRHSREGVSRAMKTAVSSPNAPKAIGPYSQSVRVGSLLFLSGQVPLDPATGQMVDG